MVVALADLDIPIHYRCTQRPDLYRSVFDVQLNDHPEVFHTVWQGPLVNDVAPVNALVSATGQVVTFDNWHSAGFGEDAVVIYDVRGKVVRAMGLGDFLPSVYVEALPRSVSSIHWSGGHDLSGDGRELVLRVVIPRDGAQLDKSRHVEVRFDLAPGTQVPLSGPAVGRAGEREVQEALEVSLNAASD